MITDKISGTTLFGLYSQNRKVPNEESTPPARKVQIVPEETTTNRGVDRGNRTSIQHRVATDENTGPPSSDFTLTKDPFDSGVSKIILV